MNPKEKRDLFFRTNPDIREMYDDILRLNTQGGYNIAALENIKSHAIAHSPFYSGYSVDDKVPIIQVIRMLRYIK